ncbi:hypothetical protein ACUNIZ_21165, partial [Serratia sp. IR-2025]
SFSVSEPSGNNMLGGADKSNGDLGSYITGADRSKSRHGVSPVKKGNTAPRGKVFPLGFDCVTRNHHW